MAFGLGACSTIPETGRRQFISPLISLADEAKMGLDAFDQIKMQERVSTDAAANARVRRIGERIASSVGRKMPNAQWEFVLFASDQVNAFALPGGKVGVYMGLLKLVSSDDELAVVVGHEIAHVTSRHGAERMTQNQVASLGAQLGSLYMNYKGVGAQTQNLAMGLYGLGAQAGVLMPFSRAHEHEADKIGLRFAAQAGYDPRAGSSFWKKMSALKGGQQTSMIEKYLSTHPLDADRIANLEKLAPEYMPIFEQARRKYR
jgi:predicted Zn-dependent protease